MLFLSISFFGQSCKIDVKEITEMILEKNKQTNASQIDVTNY